MKSPPRGGEDVADRPNGRFYIKADERNLSVVVHSLFSAWLLSFLFEGRIFYSLAEAYNFEPAGMVLCGVAAVFAGLLLCGLFIKTRKAAKGLFLSSYLFFIALSVIFFFPPSLLWTFGLIAGSFVAGGCVAAWGFCLKSGTPKNQRIKTVADMLILSNILMILCNMAAIHLSPRIGLALAMLMLLAAFVFALKLPADDGAAFVFPLPVHSHYHHQLGAYVSGGNPRVCAS